MGYMGYISRTRHHIHRRMSRVCPWFAQVKGVGTRRTHGTHSGHGRPFESDLRRHLPCCRAPSLRPPESAIFPNGVTHVDVESPCPCPQRATLRGRSLDPGRDTRGRNMHDGSTVDLEIHCRIGTCSSRGRVPDGGVRSRGSHSHSAWRERSVSTSVRSGSGSRVSDNAVLVKRPEGGQGLHVAHELAISGSIRH